MERSGVLLTRLLPPRLPSDCLERAEVVQRVVDGMRGPLVTVLAGAGYGKSTIVSQALGHVEFPFAWISCDERLGGSADLLAHVAVGIERGVPGFGAQLALDGRVENQVVALCNEIVATAAEDLVLVLDDVHLLDADATAALKLMVRDLPPSVHTVLAGRAPLPFSVGRLRAGRLVEVGERDLKLSEAETAQIWAAAGRGADAALVGDVHERTEGWIAGVLLATQTGHADATSRSPDRGLFDYLAEEVFLSQQPEVQQFLLATSVFERFSPTLAREVTGDGNARRMCDELVARHLFAVRLDADGEWYRYHHLFRAFLRARVAEIEPGLGAELQRRAGRALLGAGRAAEAVDHLLAAGELAEAADAIELLADEMLASPQTAVLARWIDAVPEALHAGRPALTLARAALTLSAGNHAVAFGMLDQAIDDLLSRGDQEQAAAAFFLLIYAQLAGGTPQRHAIDVGYRQLPRLSEGARLLPASMVMMACELGCATRYEEADQVLGRVLRLKTVGIDPLGPGYLASARALFLDHPRGRSKPALATIEWVIGLFERNERLDGLNYLLALRIYRAILLNHLGRFDEALAETGRLVDTARRRGITGGANRALTKLRSVALAGLERWDELEAELARGEPVDRMRGSSYGFRTRAPAARLAAHRGQVDVVAHHAEVVMEYVDAFGFSFDTPGWVCDVGVAAWQVGLAKEARRLQIEVVAGAERAQSPWALARGWLLGACVLPGAEADVALARALDLTEAHGVDEIWTRRDRALATAALPRALAIGLGPDGTAERLAIRAGGEVLAACVDRLASAPGSVRAAFAGALGGAGTVDAGAIDRLVGDDDPGVRTAARAARASTADRPRPPLRLAGLGGFVVHRATEAVPVSAFGRERARLLLGALMCNPGPVHREQLLEWLWPDLDAERGARAFHVTLHALRRAVEPEVGRGSAVRSVVVAEGESYRLVPTDQDSVDIDDFLALASVAGRQGGATRAALLAAEAAHAGPLFPEWPYSDWAVARRREVERARADVLHALAEDYAAQGLLREAQLRWESLVALEPERESLHRSLMRCYVEAGEKALALRQYHACRSTLRRELGIEAGAETRALYQLILEDSPLPRRQEASAA